MTTPINPLKAEIALLLRLLREGPYAGGGGKAQLCRDLNTTYTTLRSWMDPKAHGIHITNIAAIRKLAQEKGVV